MTSFRNIILTHHLRYKRINKLSSDKIMQAYTYVFFSPNEIINNFREAENLIIEFSFARLARQAGGRAMTCLEMSDDLGNNLEFDLVSVVTAEV